MSQGIAGVTPPMMDSGAAVSVEPRTDGLARRTARVAGGGVVAVGLLVLAGWVLNVRWLKGPLPGLVQMKADTAIGLLAMGTALLLSISEPAPERRLGTRLLAGVATLIGALTLAEYVLGRNLGLDELLFRDLSTVHTVNPGRLAPQTAIIFVSLGLALLLLNAETVKSRLVGGVCR